MVDSAIAKITAFSDSETSLRRTALQRMLAAFLVAHIIGL
jgi:hypothetical protein